jgi:hypothetical protein
MWLEVTVVALLFGLWWLAARDERRALDERPRGRAGQRTRR